MAVACGYVALLKKILNIDLQILLTESDLDFIIYPYPLGRGYQRKRYSYG